MKERQEMQIHFDLGAGDFYLAGYWIDLGSGMVRDATWERIEWLTANRLELLARAVSGPDALYRDPWDGRLWERTHPAPQLKGGGPPQLVLVTAEEARKKYGVPA